MNNINRLCLRLILILATSNAVWAQTILFQDDFNSPPLNATTNVDLTKKWKRGNTSTGVTITTPENYLHMVSPSGQNGWIVTQQAYPGDNTSVSLKILNPGIENDIGICPTSPSSSEPNGIYTQPNYYRFYIGGANYQPPYSLLAYRKKGGAPETPLTEEPLVLPSPYGDGTTPFYIRMRLSEGMIYFEYSLGGCYWYVMHWESFDLPGFTTADNFYYELAADNRLVNGSSDVPDVDDFKIESYPVTSYSAQPVILNDPLNSLTFNSSAHPGISRTVYGGNFSPAGWKPNSSQPNGNEVTDMVVYDLGRYLENGSLEIDVPKFYPTQQNNNNPSLNSPRHHVLAMFRQPWGTHHAVESLDTFWDLHTGNQFSGGVKFLSNTYYSCDELDTRNTQTLKPWDVNKNPPYRLKIVWDDKSLKYYRDGELHAWHILKNQMGLRYIYVGRDRTVSGDYVTNFLNNQYPTMSNTVGPIYSNLVVKEFRSNETTFPVINPPTIITSYQNAVRLQWTTGEAAVCSLEYGLTNTYGTKTRVLGPPAQTFTTLLSGLNSNTVYHYRIIAEDNAGNATTSGDFTFTTTNNGIYAFKAVADTYIEENRLKTGGTDENPIFDKPWLYGPTRASGNYGWMNLMTSAGRICYLKFDVTGVSGSISQATLQLYGRQGGATGGTLKTFVPVTGHENDWENNITWNNQSTYIQSMPVQINSITSVTANQWNPLEVTTVVQNNGNYYFALIGTGTPSNFVSCGTFDSGESTNNQPELIITTLFTEIPLAVGVQDGDAAWGDYDKDGDFDVVITGLGASGAISKIYNYDKPGNSFTEVAITPAALTPVSYSAVDWGDYDMDNDLDILLAGQAGSSPVTKIYRNDGSGSFVGIATALTGVKNCDVAWGNYDNNQDLDILLSGENSSGNSFSHIYRGFSPSTGGRAWATTPLIALTQVKYSSVAWRDNDLDGYIDVLLAGTDDGNNGLIKVYKNIKNLANGLRGFSTISTNLPQVPTASCVWGDFDKDNDLDIAFAGRQNTKTNAYAKANETTYNLVDDASLTDVNQGAVAWGDYDNDGDLDLLVTGQETGNTSRISTVYRNDPGPIFVDIGAALTGVYFGSAAWGDYDHDGDLDILLTGNIGGTSRVAKVYRNNLNTGNNSPTIPQNLLSSINTTEKTITLTWDQSTDPDNNALLTYNVMVGSGSGGTAGYDIIAPMSQISTGKRWLPAPGNTGANKFYVLNYTDLAPGGKYYWKVQAVDNVFGASAFSGLKDFTVPAAPKTAGTDSLADNESAAIPQAFALSQNYPNPFNPTTRLNLELPENGRVKAIVYDLTGQEVARLQDAEMTAGYKYLDWDGKNNFGAGVGSGTYLVKIVFEGVSRMRQEATSRVTLLK